MRILATSDLHGRSEQMDWVKQACRNADLLLLAGDLLDLGEGRETVGAWLRSIPCPLAVCSGNHDVMYEGPYWLHDLRSGTRLIDENGQIAGVPVCALPWQCDDGDWYLQAMADCAVVAGARRPWILLTHSITPHGATREAAQFENNVSARLAFYGHTHIPGCFAAWVNCGQSDFRVPNHVWVEWRTAMCTLTIHEKGSMVNFQHSLLCD